MNQIEMRRMGGTLAARRAPCWASLLGRGATGSFLPEVASLIGQSPEGREVLTSMLDKRYGEGIVAVADLSHDNPVKCVCSWPNCPWLTHTLGSEQQILKSCAWLSANAERYGLVTSRDPDPPEIREWLATPIAAVHEMSATC